MKTFPRNVRAFRIGDWPVNQFNQTILKSLREIADRNGWTIEETITDVVREFIAECELEDKIIKFPQRQPPSRRLTRTVTQVSRSTHGIT